MDNLIKFAIKAALNHEWTEAVKINTELLKENPSDVETLNRLAYAYSQCGKTDDARKLYKKILSIDKYNLIAQKNLDKISSVSKNPKNAQHKTNTSYLSPGLFIEEPGKTKSVAVSHPAPSNVLSQLSIGDEVALHPKKHSIDVRNPERIYLGALPDDIAFKLIRFIKAGNTYRVYIKNITKNGLTVFIIEEARGKKYVAQPTFISSTSENKVEPKDKKAAENEEEDEDEPKKAAQEEEWNG